VPGFEQLVLRPASIADAGDIEQAIEESRGELRQFMAWAHAPPSVAAQRARIADAIRSHWTGGDQVFCLYLSPGDVLAGMAGMHRRMLNPKGLEIGYWVRSRFAGQGLCTRAVRAMIVYGFAYLGLERISCGYDQANVGSARVNDKCGFIPEGVLRNALMCGTPELRAAGWAGTGVDMLRALIPEDVPGLDWYDGTRAELVVHDWAGRPVSALFE
jgi:RimJ/RimL family protein N-acetyltransferase